MSQIVMTFEDFHHALRIMLNLEREELVAGGVIRGGEEDFPDWDRYQVNPFRWFIRTDDERAHRLFALIEARLKPAALDAQVSITAPAMSPEAVEDMRALWNAQPRWEAKITVAEKTDE
jgi:hypothetical protein